MLYTEFIAGTRCKANEHNFKVYKNLEIMYMNTNMTKEEIYEYGKKLVDNSKTAEEVELENQLKQQLQDYKEHLTIVKAQIDLYKVALEGEIDTYWITEFKRYIKRDKDELKWTKNKIKELKFILGGN